jgi:tetratricopeptide (TPR) repeat protein
VRFQEFISELKRRRVIRALLGWGIAAFAVLQVVEPLMHALDLPDWTLKAVVAALAAGFPVTAALAWAFDLKATGVERTAPVEAVAGAGVAPGAGRLRLALLLLGLSLVAAAPGVAWVAWRQAAVRAEPAPGERIPVAVADFENDTGEAELDALSGLLITSLEQSRRLEVLTRSRMVDILRQMGHAAIPRIDESLGREVGRKASVRALVLAAIHRFDTLYTIELKALDPGTSDYLFTLKEDGKGKASIPGMIDRLSERTRERLRERPSEVASSQVKVADAITPSLEAYQHYFNGKAIQYGRGDYPAAMRELQQAAAIDPGFAMAQYEIAYLGEWTDLPEPDRRAALAAAMRSVERLPEKERALVLAWKAHQDGRDDEAEAIYARAVKAWPREKDIQFYAGDLPYHAFLSLQGSTRDLAEVLPFFEAAVALDPAGGEAQAHLVNCLTYLGRFTEAEATARAWARAAPTARAFISLGAVLAMAGRPEEGLQALRQAAEMGADPSFLVMSARILARSGRFEEAASVLAEPAGASPGFLVSVLTARADVALYQGRYREAQEVLRRVPVKVTMAERSSMPARFGTAIAAALGSPAQAWEASRALVESGGGVDFIPLHLALAGDLPHAATAAKLLVPGSRQLAFYEAAAAWRSGRLDEAATRLEALTRGRYAPDRALASALLGDLEAGRGRLSTAIPLLESYRSIGLQAGSDALRYPRSLLLLAAAYHRSGDRGRARERLDELLTLWRRADADLPMLAEAKALDARLRAGIGRPAPR